MSGVHIGGINELEFVVITTRLRSSLHLEASLVMVMETEWAVLASTMSLSPATWNLKMGSKVKAPRHVAEKPYTVDTVKSSVQPRSQAWFLVSKLTIVFGDHALANGDDHPIFLREVARGN